MSRNRHVTTNVGPTGAGKSHLTKNIILPNTDGPVFILDPQHEYDLDGSIIFEGGENPVRKFMEYMRLAYVEGAMKKYEYLILRPHKRPRQVGIAQGRDFIRRIAAAQWPGTLIVDECNRWTTQSKAIQPLHDCIIEGGHFGGQDKGLSLVFCARRLAYLGKDMTSNSHITILFRQSEDNDISRAKRVGFDASKVRNLTGHEYLTLQKESVPFDSELSPA